MDNKSDGIKVRNSGWRFGSSVCERSNEDRKCGPASCAVGWSAMRTDTTRCGATPNWCSKATRCCLSASASTARWTSEIDARGKLVAPGFIDTHVHSGHRASHRLISDVGRPDYFGQPFLEISVAREGTRVGGDAALCPARRQRGGRGTGAQRALHRRRAAAQRHHHVCRVRQPVAGAAGAAGGGRRTGHPRLSRPRLRQRPLGRRRGRQTGARGSTRRRASGNSTWRWSSSRGTRARTATVCAASWCRARSRPAPWR